MMERILRDLRTITPLLAACSLFTATSLFALEEERSRVSILLEAGIAAPMSPSDFTTNYEGGPSYGARVRYDLDEKWAVAGALASHTFKLKTNAAQRLTSQPVTGMFFYSPFRSFRWNFYGTAGLGIARHENKTFAVANESTKLTGLIGLGAELNLTRINTLSVEATGRYFGKAAPGGKDFQVGTITALIGFYIPYSWIPDKPKKPLLPLYVEDTPAEGEEQEINKQQAQAELNKVQQDILDKRIPTILFEPGKAVLVQSSFETLDIVGTVLKRYPQFSVRVEGHTDNVGGDLDNMALSQARAESVRQYLMNNFSIPPEKISALGFGETQPIADNEAEDGRAKNRRVEFKIIQ